MTFDQWFSKLLLVNTSHGEFGLKYPTGAHCYRKVLIEAEPALKEAWQNQGLENGDRLLELTAEQLSILDHTVNRAVSQRFCGSKQDPDLLELVGLGYMVGPLYSALLHAGDAYFQITEEGKRALKNRHDDKVV